MWERLCDLFWPRETSEELTLTCHPIRVQKELLRKRNLHSLDLVVAAGPYRDPQLRKIIRTFKYHRRTAHRKILAQKMCDACPGLLSVDLHDVVLVPVPLFWIRENMRGFNQSALLAEEISTKMGWPVRHLLTRIRSTGAQARRKRQDRVGIMDGAFRVRGQFSPPKTVILIDDLCTTGATLDACAFALKDAGICHVAALVCALG